MYLIIFKLDMAIIWDKGQFPGLVQIRVYVTNQQVTET